MMTAKDYGVEVIVAYENKRVGQVIFPPGTLRQRLINGGLARAVQAPKAAAEEPRRQNRQDKKPAGDLLP